LTVKNIGENYLSGNINSITVNAQESEKLDVYKGEYSGSLYKDNSVEFRLTPALIKNLTNIYRLGAIADYTLKIPELDENNNTLEKTITIAADQINKPDLTVNDIKFTGTKQNEKGTLSVTIKNLGANMASSAGLLNWYNNFVEQHFTYSVDPTTSSMSEKTDRPWPSESNPLKTNETITISWYGYFNNPGNLNIKYTVDNANAQAEANENNNTLEKIITISADSPKFTITNINISPTTKLINVTVKNTGVDLNYQKTYWINAQDLDNSEKYLGMLVYLKSGEEKVFVLNDHTYLNKAHSMVENKESGKYRIKAWVENTTMEKTINLSTATENTLDILDINVNTDFAEENRR